MSAVCLTDNGPLLAIVRPVCDGEKCIDADEFKTLSSYEGPSVDGLCRFCTGNGSTSSRKQAPDGSRRGDGHQPFSAGQSPFRRMHIYFREMCHTLTDQRGRCLVSNEYHADLEGLEGLEGSEELRPPFSGGHFGHGFGHGGFGHSFGHQYYGGTGFFPWLAAPYFYPPYGPYYPYPYTPYVPYYY